MATDFSKKTDAELATMRARFSEYSMAEAVAEVDTELRRRINGATPSAPATSADDPVWMQETMAQAPQAPPTQPQSETNYIEWEFPITDEDLKHIVALDSQGNSLPPDKEGDYQAVFKGVERPGQKMLADRPNLYLFTFETRDPSVTVNGQPACVRGSIWVDFDQPRGLETFKSLQVNLGFGMIPSRMSTKAQIPKNFPCIVKWDSYEDSNKAKRWIIRMAWAEANYRSA